MEKKLPVGKALKKNILSSVDNLPPMPQIIHKAQECLQDPNSSFTEIAKLIETDQSLAMNVLRIANSAYYRRMKKVSSIQDATIVLGIASLVELLTMACASTILSSELKGYGLTANALWRHSITVAFGSKIVAKKKYPAQANDDFSAGLIHDVGKLILDPFVLERKEIFSEYMSDGEQTFLDAEKEILGFQHAEIAAIVCEKWNFPKSTSIAIKHHHNPSKSRGNIHAYIVNVADQIATWIGMEIDGITVDISDNSLEKLGIGVHEIEPIIDSVSDLVNRVLDESYGNKK